MRLGIGELRGSVQLSLGLCIFGLACVYWRVVALGLLVIFSFAVFHFPTVVQIFAGAFFWRTSKVIALALLAGGLAAATICWMSPWDRPNFGNDVAGNMAGAGFYFRKAQLVGWCSLGASALVGVCIHCLRNRLGGAKRVPAVVM